MKLQISYKYFCDVQQKKHVSVFCDTHTYMHICFELKHHLLHLTHQTEASWPLQCEEHASPVTRAAQGHFELKTVLEM